MKLSNLRGLIRLGEIFIISSPGMLIFFWFSQITHMFIWHHTTTYIYIYHIRICNMYNRSIPSTWLKTKHLKISTPHQLQLKRRHLKIDPRSHIPRSILGGADKIGTSPEHRPGRKRWFLSPPEVASWSLDPVAVTEMKSSMVEIGREWIFWANL